VGHRRGRRPSTQAAVLEATTELLRTLSFADLSVARILAAANVGRTSFYEHFSSKDDVLVKLVKSISEEIAEEIAPMFERGQRTIDDAYREALNTWMRLGARYGPLMVTATEEWPRIPELRRLWFATLGHFGRRLAERIDRDRAAGIAPPGADSEALAASLAWATERAFHIAIGGHHTTLTDVDSIIEPLVQLYVGTIYGCAVERPRRRSRAIG
jgi:TetR/AcrR family transcriptional regulator, ethionamide resistance regulator